MDFREFGNQSDKTLLLLPGTACTWQMNFKYVVDDLAEKYRVIAVNYDGFEGDPSVVFTDMLTVTEKIEDYAYAYVDDMTVTYFGQEMPHAWPVFTFLKEGRDGEREIIDDINRIYAERGASHDK